MDRLIILFREMQLARQLQCTNNGQILRNGQGRPVIYVAFEAEQI